MSESEQPDAEGPTGPDLATGLAVLASRSQSEQAAGPPVAELRSLAEARATRRRQLGVAGAVVAAVALILGGVLAWPQDRVRVDAGPATDETDRGEPTTTTTVAATPVAPADEADQADQADDDADANDADDRWSMLVPSGDWVPSFISTQVDTELAGFVARMFFAATPDDGPFGPVVTAGYNDGLLTRDYGDGPRRWYEVDSPAGTTVRIGTDGPPNRLTGIFVVGDGSIAVQAFDLDEAELLAVIDGLAVDGLRVVHDGRDLPKAIEPVVMDLSGPAYSSTVVANRGETERVDVRVEFGQSWWPVLDSRTLYPDATRADRLGFRILINERDGLQDAGAVLCRDERAYTITEQRWAENSEPLSPEELIEVIDGLELRTAPELEQLFDMTPRAELYRDLLADAPLPPGSDLTWLTDGPPIDEFQATGELQQATACEWVDHWTATGDPEAIDTIENAAAWPITARLVELEVGFGFGRDDAGRLFFEDGVLDEARSSTTEDERRASALRTSCSWWLGQT